MIEKSKKEKQIHQIQSNIIIGNRLKDIIQKHIQDKGEEFYESKYRMVKRI